MPEISTDDGEVMRLNGKSRAVEMVAVMGTIVIVVVVFTIGTLITSTDGNGCTKEAVALARVGQGLVILVGGRRSSSAGTSAQRPPRPARRQCPNQCLGRLYCFVLAAA